MNIQEAIQNRYSCRIYEKRPIQTEVQQQLAEILQGFTSGPMGTPIRFMFAAENDQERDNLRGLGTYGFIRNPTGFIIATVQEKPHALEDFGYRMEQVILEATRLGLATCWLGGSFTQSSFAARIGKREDESLPAVAACGYAAAEGRARDLIRRQARSDSRLPWEAILFKDEFGRPLLRKEAGALGLPLEMVRLAPSASNKQPWRILKAGRRLHFYLERTQNYGRGSLAYTLLGLADLQRVDIGIAMCHLELAARETGLEGAWVEANPGLPLPNEHTSYILSWQIESS